MKNEALTEIQKAIREESLDGWLFCNFRHRDRLSDEILERPPGLSNSRFWFYAVPASGEPARLVHAIETDHLDGLPGSRKTYSCREELLRELSAFGGKRWGVHVSQTVSAVSWMDAGTYALLSSAGLELVSAEGLVQRFKGLLSPEGTASHERAAVGLYEIVGQVWDFVRSAYNKNTALCEGDLRQIMEDGFTRRGLVRDHPPLAAAGIHSANPHYDFNGPGSPVREGDIIQLDLWAKENNPGAVYADISWAGFFGKKPPREAEEAFAVLVEAREETLRFIGDSLASGRRPSGAETDAHCRAFLCAAGYAGAIKHRTGHGIDTECHGSGVNIDAAEFPDSRLLLEASCFSLEPGIYLSAYGFRTEIDVYISGGQPRVSGPGVNREGRQFSLLCC